MGDTNKDRVEFDMRLMEGQLYNFIFQRARDRNDENSWTDAVIEVFGHTRFEELPDTESDPPDPGWLKVDAIMEEYHVAERKRDEEDAKQLRKIMRGG
jgi:hypothetical protein